MRKTTRPTPGLGTPVLLQQLRGTESCWKSLEVTQDSVLPTCHRRAGSSKAVLGCGILPAFWLEEERKEVRVDQKKVPAPHRYDLCAPGFWKVIFS